MPFSQFIDGNAFTQSVSSGIRDTASLAQLQRTLRESDRQFAFDQQADPFRLQDFQNNARINAVNAGVSEATQAAQIDATNANALLLQSKARTSVASEASTIAQAQAEASLAQSAADVNFRTRDALVENTGLTLYDNRTNAALNRARAQSELTDIGQRSAIQGSIQARTNAAAEVAGVTLGKDAQVDYTTGVNLRNAGVVDAASLLNGSSAQIGGVPSTMGRTTNTPGLGGTPLPLTAHAQSIVNDITAGGALSRTLTAAGLTPEAQQGLIAPILQAQQENAAVTQALGQTRESADKGVQDVKKLENTIIDLQRQLAEAKLSNVTGSTTPSPVPTAAQAARTGTPIDPANPSIVASPDGTPLPVSTVTPAPSTRPLQSAPRGDYQDLAGPDGIVSPAEMAQRIPLTVIEGVQTVSGVFNLAPIKVRDYGNGVADFDEQASPLQRATQIGVSRGSDAGAVDLAIIDPRGDTSDLFRALIAQESGGNQRNASGGVLISKAAPGGGTGGAMGIAQLMPDTARGIARKHGIPFSMAQVTGDAAYNFNLGRLHFNDLLKEFGSVPLALAGYNAGSGLVNHAVRRLGDPRKGEISDSDFIARLPSVMKNNQTQTRDYVQKIMGRYAQRRNAAAGRGAK